MEEVLLRQLVEGIGAAHEFEGLVHVPAAFEGHADDRLGQDVKGIAWDVDTVDFRVVGRLREGRAFHEIPGFEDDHPPSGRLAVGMPGAADPLKALGDGLR